MRITLSDLRYAARLSLRRPGFTLSAVLMLGIVTGAATIVFGMVDAVLLRPLPFREPARLVSLWNRPAQPGVPRLEISLGELGEWRARSRGLEGSAVITTVANEIAVTADGAPVRARFAMASANFFSVLGIEAALGRTFQPAVEDRLETRTVLLSDAFWRLHFGADPRVIGRRLALDGERYEVVGVLPRDLPFPRGADLWLPLGPLIQSAPQWPTLRIFEGVARLRPGVSLAQASAELDHISAHPRPDLAWRPSPVWMIPLTEEILGDSRDALRLTAGAAGLLLLIACANVAALLLARAVERQREMALRSALGAGQGRLIGLLLTESLLLAALAAALALPLAFAGLRLVASRGPVDIPRLDTACLDARALAFAVTVSLLSVALFGLVPAFEAIRLDRGAVLRAGRVRLLLVAGQAALAAVVLVLAGLTAASFFALRRADLGFAPAGRLAFRLQLTGNLSGEEEAVRFRALLGRLERISGVDGAGAVLKRPLTGPIGWDYLVALEGQTARQQAANPIVNHERSSPGYFRTMEIPLLRGRDFTWNDTGGAPPVAIVSRSAAERLWPGQSPLGKRLLWSVEPERGWITVVGEVGDVRYREVAGVRPDIYVPFQQNPSSSMDIVLRSALPAGELAGPVARAVHEVDSGIPAPELIPLRRTVGAAVARPRLRALLLGTFAALAVLLAAVGVYGSVASAVAQRRREIAVRLALGAGRGHLLRLALGRVFAAVALGLAAGLAAYAAILADSRASTRLAGLLYGIGPGDPAILLAAPLCLLAVALCGALLPVCRALRTDAAEALRAE